MLDTVQHDSMDRAILSPLPTFFVKRLTYNIAILRVILSVEGIDHLEVRFEPPRAFRSFSESDYWHYLNEFDGSALVQSIDTGCGIWMSQTAPYLLDYREHVRYHDTEDTFSCLISTPQECVEVICFEEPSITMI